MDHFIEGVLFAGLMVAARLKADNFLVGDTCQADTEGQPNCSATNDDDIGLRIDVAVAIQIKNQVKPSFARFEYCPRRSIWVVLTMMGPFGLRLSAALRMDRPSLPGQR